MTKWKMCVCLALLAGPATLGAAEGKPAVPVYTNDDLERMRPFRDETGVASVPAFPPDGRSDRSVPDAAGAKGRGRSTDRHSEAYWRGQAERVREQLRKLDAQAEDLRRRIAAARPDPWSSSSHRRRAPPRDTSATSALQARLAAVEERRRQVETDLLDRARKDGAMPGWLR